MTESDPLDRRLHELAGESYPPPQRPRWLRWLIADTLALVVVIGSVWWTFGPKPRVPARHAAPQIATTRHAAPQATTKPQPDHPDKTVYVRSYTRRDGTVVRAHWRRPPGTAKLKAALASAPSGR